MALGRPPTGGKPPAPHPGKPPRRRTPSPTEVLRQSSDDLRPLLAEVVEAEGDTLSKLFVLSARTLEQVSSTRRELGDIGSRLVSLELKVDEGHACLHDSDLEALERGVGEVQLEQAASLHLAEKMGDRLDRLEARDIRARKWWQSLFGIFALAIVGGYGSAVWWLSDHAANDRQDHIQVSDTKLTVATLKTEVESDLNPRVKVLEERTVRHSERLTMLEQ